MGMVRGGASTRLTSEAIIYAKAGTGANCTKTKVWVGGRAKLLPPWRESWKLCYDGVEMVGVAKGKLGEEMGDERLVEYPRDTRGWGGD